MRLRKVWIQQSSSNYGQIIGQTVFFNFGMATNLEEKNSEFKLFELQLKIDLVSHPARAEVLVNTYIIQKRSFRYVSTSGKLGGISMPREPFLAKIIAFFIYCSFLYW